MILASSHRPSVEAVQTKYRKPSQPMRAPRRDPGSGGIPMRSNTRMQPQASDTDFLAAQSKLDTYCKENGYHIVSSAFTREPSEKMPAVMQDILTDMKSKNADQLHSFTSPSTAASPKANRKTSVPISNGARLKVPRKVRLYSNIRTSSATARARTDSPKSSPKKLKRSTLYMTASSQATA